jgi:hypothetical protein
MDFASPSQCSGTSIPCTSHASSPLRWGTLKIIDSVWGEGSRDSAISSLDQMLSVCDPELLADFRRFLKEVGL